MRRAEIVLLPWLKQGCLCLYLLLKIYLQPAVVRLRIRLIIFNIFVIVIAQIFVDKAFIIFTGVC